MDWLLVMSLVGLMVAVLALGGTVVALVAWIKRQQMSSEKEQTRQDQLDAPKEDLMGAGEVDVLPKAFRGFQNPRQAFKEAFRKGDVQAATVALPDLKRVLGPEHPEYLLSAGALACAGEQSALQPLLDVIDSNSVRDEDILTIILSGIVQYYVSTDCEHDGLIRVEENFKRYVNDESSSSKFRSHIANQLSMLYVGAEKIDDALVYVKLAIELVGDEPAYHFNLSILYEKRNELEQAIGAIGRCMDMSGSTPDPDHLFQAWDLHRQVGDREKMATFRSLIDRSGGGGWAHQR